MKRVLIITTSLRKNSNSDLLADKFKEGVAASNNDVELISLKGKKIAFCLGCLACQKTKECIIKDDAILIANKVSNADVIVWVTPTYYYSVSGQMKTLIDRMNSLYVRDNKFKEVYLLVVAADTEDYTPEGPQKVVEGWVNCFDGVEFKDTLFIGDVNNPNDMKNNEEALLKAFEMGKNI